MAASTGTATNKKDPEIPLHFFFSPTILIVLQSNMMDGRTATIGCVGSAADHDPHDADCGSHERGRYIDDRHN